VIKSWNSPLQQQQQQQQQHQQQQPSTSGPTTAAAQPPPGKQKKKLDLKEVFNTDDDEDSNLGSGKKRKLVPLGVCTSDLLNCPSIEEWHLLGCYTMWLL
jgi:hypothetical protein